jgi:hypothetical protein
MRACDIAHDGARFGSGPAFGQLWCRFPVLQPCSPKSETRYPGVLAYRLSCRADTNLACGVLVAVRGPAAGPPAGKLDRRCARAIPVLQNTHCSCLLTMAAQPRGEQLADNYQRICQEVNCSTVPEFSDCLYVKDSVMSARRMLRTTRCCQPTGHRCCRRGGSTSCSITSAGSSDDHMYAVLSLVPYAGLERLEVSLTLVRAAQGRAAASASAAASTKRARNAAAHPAPRAARFSRFQGCKTPCCCALALSAQLPEVWLALADTCAKSTSLRSLKLGHCGIGQLGELQRVSPRARGGPGRAGAALPRPPTAPPAALQSLAGGSPLRGARAAAASFCPPQIWRCRCSWRASWRPAR